MKIVFVIPNMTGGGTERVISLMAHKYIQKGYEVAIMQFAGYEHAYDLPAEVEDFSVAEQSGRNPLNMLAKIKRMRKYWKDNSDCHIWAWCVRGAIYSVLSTRFMKNKPHILVGERNDPRSCDTPRMRDWAYHRADVITFQTREAIVLFDEKVAAKAVVIPNPIDASSLPERFEGERRHRIVTVGRLHKQKNQRLLLDAFAEFRKKYDFYRLELYGTGPLETELKEYANSIGLGDSVIWHGFCSDVKTAISDARMFVLSSDFEGISNSMLEALAIGVPVISTDCPIYGARTYIQNGVNGILTPVGDKGALVDAMLKVAQDDELTNTLSRGGAALRDEYSVDRIAELFLRADGII